MIGSMHIAMYGLVLVQSQPQPISKPVHLNHSNPIVRIKRSDALVNVLCEGDYQVSARVSNGSIEDVTVGDNKKIEIIDQAKQAFGNRGIVYAGITCQSRNAVLLLKDVSGNNLASLIVPYNIIVDRVDRR